MSKEEIRTFTRRFFEAWNNGKEAAMAAIDESNAGDVVFHLGIGRDVHGLKELREVMSELFSAVPDLHLTIDDMMVEGDKVAIRYTLTGTFKGEFAGIPPTNRKATIWLLEIDHVVNGKFVEGWVRFDTLGFMQQLGAIPTRKS
jgi:steroid delta-isomerase-like uncharacterized protein